jgi:hypothetical protein
MKIVAKSVILATLALTLSACDMLKKEEEKEKEAAKTELQGTWKSACEADSGGDSQNLLEDGDGYKASTMKFDGDKFERIMGMYTDAACATQMFEMVLGGTFKIGDAVGTDGTKKIDYTLAEGTVMVSMAEAVAMFNSAQMGGYTDWELNKKKDILGKNMDPGKTDAEPMPNKGDVIYDVFKINGTTVSTGDDVVTTEAERPTAVSADEVYTKQ